MRQPVSEKGHQWKTGGIWIKCVVSLKGGGSVVFYKEQMINILGFVGHVVSFETTVQKWSKTTHLSQWVWLNSNKTLYTKKKPGAELDLVRELRFLTPGQ